MNESDKDREIEMLRRLLVDLIDKSDVINTNNPKQEIPKLYCRGCFKQFKEIDINKKSIVRVMIDGFVIGVAILVFLFILAVIVTLSSK